MGPVDNNNIVVFSCGYNCQNYVEKHIESISSQVYKYFNHMLIDDASPDSTYLKIKEYKASNNNVWSVYNSERQYPLENMVSFLGPKDQDIVVLVDMDDYLLHDHVFTTINDIYKNTNCWMTYGSFIWSESGQIEGEEYPENVRQRKLYREYDWRCVHPQTFRGFLWNNLDKKLLRDKNNTFFRCTCDMAVMFPLMEMCPTDKVVHIHEPLYVYNTSNPLNLMKILKQEQKDNEHLIREMPKCKELK